MSTKTNKNWKESHHFRVNSTEQAASQSQKHQQRHQAYKQLCARHTKTKKETVLTLVTECIQTKQPLQMGITKQSIKQESTVCHQNAVTCLRRQRPFLTHNHHFLRYPRIHLMLPPRHR